MMNLNYNPTLILIIHEFVNDCEVNDKKVEKFESEFYPNTDTQLNYDTLNKIGVTIPTIILNLD